MFFHFLARTSLIAATLGVTFVVGSYATAQSPPLGVYGGIHTLSTQFVGPTTTNGEVPISGFIPRVVVGLTDERTPDDGDFFAADSNSPGGNSLPLGGDPFYTNALLNVVL